MARLRARVPKLISLSGSDWRAGAALERRSPALTSKREKSPNRMATHRLRGQIQSRKAKPPYLTTAAHEVGHAVARLVINEWPPVPGSPLLSVEILAPQRQELGSYGAPPVLGPSTLPRIRHTARGQARNH